MPLKCPPHTSWFKTISQRYKSSKKNGMGIKIDTQTNGTDLRPEISLCIYDQLIFDKGAKNTPWGKDNLVNVGKLNNHMKKNKIGPYLTPLTRTNLKWITDIKRKTWNHKTCKRKHREKPLDTDLGNEFSDLTPKAKATKAKINKWDYI